RSPNPLARRSRMACSVVSTWANTPRTLAVAISVMPSVGAVLEGVRQDLLDLHDRQRRHHPDESQEEQEEPGEGGHRDGAVHQPGEEDPPGVRVEVVAQAGDDDV